MNDPRSSILPFLLILLAAGCGGETDPGPGADAGPEGDGGEDDADAAADAGDEAPTVAEQVAGAWDLDRLTCAGTAVPEPYDGARVSLEIAGDRLTVALTRASCALTVPFALEIDEATATVRGTPGGPTTCVPEACSEQCGVEAAGTLPPLTAVAAFPDADHLTLTTEALETLTAAACDGAGLTVPGVETYRRPDVPIAIDDGVCDVDAFAPGRTIYYVAAEEPGADDDACDGLAPTDEGGGHCPFRSLSTTTVRQKLFQKEDGTWWTHSVTVALRTGTYFVEPLELAPDIPGGLWIQSNAATRDEAIVLTSYEGERAVLDGTCPAEVVGCDSPEDPGRIWELLTLRGQFVVVRDLGFDNVHKWNVTVASSDTCVRDNTFVGSYGSDSDSLKSFEGSGPNVIVRGNDFHDGFEQAMDLTNAFGWLIEDNDIHGGRDRGLGFKLGATQCLVRGNRFSDLPGQAISLGGTSSAHAYPEESSLLVAEGNVVTNVGFLADVFSCRGCALRDNVVDGARFGVLIRGVEPSGCAGGCAATSNLELTGNRFRNLAGDDPPVEEGALPNTFVGMFDASSPGLVAGDNLYCTLPGFPENFAVEGALVGFTEWQERTGTDETSSLVSSETPECTGAW